MAAGSAARRANSKRCRRMLPRDRLRGCDGKATAMTAASTTIRIEHDSMGELQRPRRRAVRRADPARGAELPDLRPAHAARLHPRARAWSRRRPPRSTRELGLLPKAEAQAIRAAALDGRRRRARRAVPDRRLPDRLGHLEQHERQRGDRDARLARRGKARCIPNDHVNLGQSSNDVIPTAIQRRAQLALRRATCCRR